MQRDKRSRPASLIMNVLTITVCLPAVPCAAQGISEYGGLMGMPRTMPTGHAGALQNLYGAGSLDKITGQQAGAGGGLPVVGDSRVIARNIADKANAFFNEAQKKEKAGKIAEAEQLYRSSAVWRERVWGTKDPAVYVIYGKIGALCTKQNKLPEAEQAYRRQIACAVKIYGAGAYEMCPTLVLLAENCVAQNKMPDAINSYRQVYQLRKRKMGDTNRETLSAMLKLATCIKQGGNSVEGDAMAKEGARLAALSPDNALLVQAFNDVINPPAQAPAALDASAAASPGQSPVGSAPQANPGTPGGELPAASAPGAASTSPQSTAPTAPSGKSCDKASAKSAEGK